ncbi:hypothetical protein SASPL_109256 [Salvia splendens]|uniref:HIG1 domain-containing protein n=1 Tax=Salvia splendens TaxID=180675 RepID=A0A8X8YG69_SALSN|nr:hypothetical protein SASPL_109256 [Salvia splendens]
MGEEKGKIQALREWVVEHKLRTVGTLWASGILGSMAYNWSQPNMKTSVKIIHASKKHTLVVPEHGDIMLIPKRANWSDFGILSMVISGFLCNRQTEVNLGFLISLVDFRGEVSQKWLHAQALTLAALSGAAIVEYYDHKSGAKTERVSKFLDLKENQHKN